MLSLMLLQYKIKQKVIEQALSRLDLNEDGVSPEQTAELAEILLIDVKSAIGKLMALVAQRCTGMI